ncbi:MAG TPA: hypothetical protein VM557_10385 [Thermoanaerobaculia bacterium]|nr:hypothetical protein [Thermoanaerobaculia bacterium]
MNRRILFALALFLLPLPVLAWGEKGHRIASEAATFAMPPALPPFFHQAYPNLVYLGYDPDRWRGAGDSADAVNAPDHFLDYEYVAHLELPRDRYEMIDLLHESGTIRRFGITTATSGFVVWRIAELSEYLENQWRLWRRTPDGLERDQIEANIIHFAGILGHYVSDSANPHHSTIHYNGWVGDPARGFRNDCGTHSRFESVFVSNSVELEDALSQLRPLRPIDDYFEAAFALIRDSNGEVVRLYELDAAGAFDDRGTDAGKAFAAERLAIGASTLRDFWVATWNRSAGRPGTRR